MYHNVPEEVHVVCEVCFLILYSFYQFLLEFYYYIFLLLFACLLYVDSTIYFYFVTIKNFFNY